MNLLNKMVIATGLATFFLAPFSSGYAMNEDEFSTWAKQSSILSTSTPLGNQSMIEIKDESPETINSSETQFLSQSSMGCSEILAQLDRAERDRDLMLYKLTPDYKLYKKQQLEKLDGLTVSKVLELGHGELDWEISDEYIQKLQKQEADTMK